MWISTAGDVWREALSISIDKRGWDSFGWYTWCRRLLHQVCHPNKRIWAEGGVEEAARARDVLGLTLILTAGGACRWCINLPGTSPDTIDNGLAELSHSTSFISFIHSMYIAQMQWYNIDEQFSCAHTSGPEGRELYTLGL